MKDLPTMKKIISNKLLETGKMYATNYTYVGTRVVYQVHHTELLTVDPLIRPAEATLEVNHCITIFVVNQAEER
jgi:hypothetical protein